MDESVLVLMMPWYQIISEEILSDNERLSEMAICEVPVFTTCKRIDHFIIYKLSITYLEFSLIHFYELFQTLDVMGDYLIWGLSG